MISQISTFHIFFHSSNKRAVLWAEKIERFLRNRFPQLKKDTKRPEVVIVLGGDGTILEAARKYHELGSVILGLNLGNVGFLASVRKEKDFLKALANFLKKKFGIIERMMLSAQVKRRGKVVFTAEALNEIVVKNPLGMVELQAKVAGHPVQYIRGTGLLVSTATGSTAYNLSAHGPIVMPDIKCFVITELLDHSIPSPSMVVKYNSIVDIKVVSFKKRGIISLSKTNKKIDVLLIADGESFFPLEEKDEITIRSSPHLVKFAELEKNYFFKSLKEKFGFK
ncbi:MAG: NAD(+)/NADH kinase [Candidatus Taylorbacteria bacterium]|nr:NAD(+)/NADH kinase [Candidatus Taylorbacteria bacterium]